jgi:glycosyltransferase involved in cell wall biosynthesis
LRLKFESLGARVQVVDTTELRAARAADTLEGSLQSLAAVVGLNDAAWVVANTVSTWWGVHLASQGGRPVIFYIHESTPPRVFFRGLLAPAALARAEEAFRLADRVSFLTASTQRYYASLSDQANYCRNPGWIDLAAIDRFRASTARETLRQQLGFPPDRKIVINVGTVCERKGQHLFARAVDLLWQNSPDLAASALFLMVGGRATPYDRALADFLAGLGRDNLRVMPETGEIYPYYGAADLFVCSSYEESFPRVILEAMAFALPIVSADVHGIPEMVRPGHEAWLVPAGDSAALAAALGHALAKPDEGRVRGRQARHRVATEYDSRVVLPRHAALARTLTGGAA